jgi:hypothetical protein
MAQEKFGRPKAKATLVKKTQLKDTIRRVPVKDAKRAGRVKGSRRNERAVAAVVAA